MSDPLKVLIIITGLRAGGAERHLLRTLPGLRARGLDVRVAALEPGGMLEQPLRDTGVPVRVLPWRLPRPLRMLCGLVWLMAWMAWWRPRVVHAYLPEAYAVGGVAAWLTRRPKRYLARRSTGDYQRRIPMAAPLERWLHQRMHGLVANARPLLTELRAEAGPQASLFLIHNGLDQGFAESLPTRTAARQSLAIAEDTSVFLTVANLWSYKGYRDLLQAFSDVKRRLPSAWQALWAGADEGEGDGLRTAITEAGLDDHIKLLGIRNDVPVLLAAADVFVLPSHEEGLPNVVLEAMAASLPCVATAVGGTPDLIVADETGYLVPPHDPKALGNAVLMLAGDPDRRRAMGSAGQARWRAHFTLATCIDRHEALYRDALAPETGV